MSDTRPASVIPIQPIDFDVAERVTETFAKQRNIPTMAFPLTSSGEGQGTTPPVTPQVVAVEPAPRSEMRRMSLDLPSYVFDDIRQRALDGKCSARFVILKALRSAGIHIKEDDMAVDGRRDRGQ
jgi:hypothetical protein